MKKYYFLFTVCFSTFFLRAQTPGFSWSRHMEGTSEADALSTAVATDTSGNVFMAGYFSDTLDADPGSGTVPLYSAGEYDAILSKFDASGNLLWVNQIGNAGDDALFSAVTDAAGNVYCSGVFSDTVDVDPGSGVVQLISEGDLDIFILKFNSSGALQWAKQVSGQSLELGFSLHLDASGNIYLAGTFEDVVDFNPGSGTNTLTASGYEDAFVLKLDNSGNYVWAKQFAGSGGSNFGIAYSVGTDASGNVYTAGVFDDAVDFNPGSGTMTLTSFGSNDIFVCKLNSSGNFVWARQLGGTDYEECRSMVVDGSSNVYLTGAFEGVADFNPGVGTANLTSNGSLDAFVAKLDASGNYAWAKKIGGSDYDQSIGIARDNGTGVYVTGSFEDVVDFDPGGGTANMTAKGYDDIFVLKLTTNGAYSWVQQMGGSNSGGQGQTVTSNASGAVYSSGYFNGTIDFDPGTGTNNATATGFDMYLHKLQQCVPTAYTHNATGCNSYTINGQTYTNTGTYTQTLTNVAGCDSILTIKLTLQNSFSTIDTVVCKHVNINGTTYNTTGVFTQKLTNNAGCDSLITINVWVKNTDTLITAVACKSYTLNGTTYDSSATYTQLRKNKAGCDSTITLVLTISSQSTSGSITQTVCDSVKINGQTFNSSGTYSQTLTNVGGCDSFLTINLTVNKSGKLVLTETACDGFTLNGTTYSGSGTYTQNLKTTKGCDSIIVLNLTITNVNVSVTQSGATLTAAATGATYQWISCADNTPISGAIQKVFTATANGNYAVVVTQNSCTDTSSCYVVMGLGSVGDVSINGSINVYPNPAADKVQIVLSKPLENATLRLWNQTGQEVLQKTGITGSKFELELQNQPQGIYILEIATRGAIYRTRVQIQ